LLSINRHTDIAVELGNPGQRNLGSVFANVISLKKELQDQQLMNCHEVKAFVTLHGKTGKKVNGRARVRWHGTLSMSHIARICAYLLSKTKNVTVDIVWHAEAFI